jgi:asparagine synthase (glutamine-hydrolysing)
MCGITAVFSKKGVKPNKELIFKMNEAIIHRGPDDQGYHEGDWFLLGFRRLSIIDLSNNGHQPMYSHEGRYVIIFNGEIYNFLSIKKELIRLGHKFTSSTDTEVVLYSFIEWGNKCVDRFVGMFACIIMDLDNQTAFIVRDHLGIKPLYVYEDDDYILFSSELKAFLSYKKFELNERFLYEQFLFRYVSGNNTLIRNVSRFAEGTFAEINRFGGYHSTRYYDVADSLINSKRKKIDYDEIQNELDDSIKFHTYSDVGYNVQLSGGLDSSYITAALANQGEKLRTYSIELPGFEKDESAYQRFVANEFKTEHHPIPITSRDYIDYLEKMTWHLETPIVHGADVLLMLLCGHAKETSKVILTGEGADELFGGYSRYIISNKTRLNFKLRAVLTSTFGENNFLIKKLGWENYEPGLDEQIYVPQKYFPEIFNIEKSDYSFRRSNTERFPDVVRRIIISDQTSYLASLLERQDKLSMSNSVETRVPFVTWKLFDLVNSYDFEEKINPTPKKILKKIAEKYFSKEFVYRKKVGFVLPYSDWLRDERGLKQYLDTIRSSSFRDLPYFNHQNLSKLIDSHLDGSKDNSKILMLIIFFEIWRKTFISREIVA